VIYSFLLKFKIKTDALLGYNSAWIPKKLISKTIKNQLNPVVIDVGCNVGEFSELVFKNNKTSVIYAFDIHQDLQNILEKKFNQLKFTFFPVAISNKLELGHIESSSKTDRKAHLTYESNKNSKSVPVKTLDNIMRNLDLKKIAILKIDTEGNDFNVLRGADYILNITDLVIFEIMYRILIYGDEPDDAIQYLKSKGFKYFYRSTKFFGLIPIKAIKPWDIMTQNIVASKSVLTGFKYWYS